jgi:hypothetical protein
MYCRGVVLALVLCLPFVACKRLFSPPSLATKSAAEGRRVAMGVGLLPNLDRSLVRIEEIAKGINLPFDVAAMRQKLLTEIKVPPEAATAISLTMPIALVMLPSQSPTKEPEATAALSLASVDKAKQVAGAFGKPVATQGDAASFKQADGTIFWIWRKANNIVVSTSLDALVTGASLALESLAKSEDDLIVTVNPDAIARSQGTDVKSALTAYAKQLEDAAKASGENPATLSFTNLIVKTIGEKVAEIDEATLTVRIDPTLGGTITTAIKPKAGSSLAQMITKSSPYTIDPAILTDSEPFMLAASSPTPWVAGMWRTLGPALTQRQVGATLAKSLETIFTSMTGAFSFTTRMEGKQWQQAVVYQLAPNVSADAYLDQIMALYKSPELQKLFNTFDMKVKFNVTRDKNVVSGDLKFDANKMPARQAMAMKSILGDKYQFALAAEKGRIWMATGKDARAQVTRLAPAGTKTPPLNVAAAIEETRSADAFLYLDLMQSIRLGLEATPMGKTIGQAPGMASLSMPMWFFYRGGPTATLGWRIPMITVRSVGSIVPLLLMFAGGAQ